MHRLLIEQIRRTTNTATTRNKRAHNNKRQLNNGIVPEPHTKLNKRQHQQHTNQNTKTKTTEQTLTYMNINKHEHKHEQQTKTNNEQQVTKLQQHKTIPRQHIKTQKQNQTQKQATTHKRTTNNAINIRLEQRNIRLIGGWSGTTIRCVGSCFSSGSPCLFVLFGGSPCPNL